jgi:hypothetical protein
MDRESNSQYRLSAGDLRHNHLPQELEAYPFYPEGIHIPVSEVGTIILTPTGELDVPCFELGVYDYEMSSEGAISIDIPLTELEDSILHLMIEIRQDRNWVHNANLLVQRWFDEGRG